MQYDACILLSAACKDNLLRPNEIRVHYGTFSLQQPNNAALPLLRLHDHLAAGDLTVHRHVEFLL